MTKKINTTFEQQLFKVPSYWGCKVARALYSSINLDMVH